MNFFKKETPTQQMRKNDREIRANKRELGRTRNELEKEEAKLKIEIKNAAKKGNKPLMNQLAKNLIQVRKQIERVYGADSQMSAVQTQNRMMKTNITLGTAMQNTSKVMGQINKTIDPQKTMQIMRDFDRENQKMSMKEDMMNDVLADIMCDDEGEEDAVIDQVLSEIGIEMNSKIAAAPMPGTSRLAPSETVAEDDEIEKKLAALKALD